MPLSFLMMAPMVQSIVFLDLSNNSIPHLVESTLKNAAKLRHVAMYFQKSARQWWASLCMRGIAPRTWNECKEVIMKQFLTNEAEENCKGHPPTLLHLKSKLPCILWVWVLVPFFVINVWTSKAYP